MITCEESVAELAPLLGGRLPIERARALEGHLEACPGCREAADEELALRGLLERSLDEPASEPADRALLAAIVAGDAASDASKPRRRSWVRIAAAAALVLALLPLLHPCYHGRCGNRSEVLVAFAALRDAPAPPEAVGLVAGSDEAPAVSGLRLVGGRRGQDGRTTARYVAEEGVDVVVNRPEHAHLHLWQTTRLGDGRAYLVEHEAGDARLVWVDERGRLWCARAQAADAALAVASRVRAVVE